MGAAAQGEHLIFTDADVTWEPGALAAVMAYWASDPADLLGPWPRQDNRRLGERLITPQVDTLLLTGLPWPVLARPEPAAAAANGQVLAFRRTAYEAVGGHALVRGEILEDVLFAQRLKGAGYRLSLVLGGDLIRVRMYRSYAESVRGFGKNLRSAHAGQRRLMVLSALFGLLSYTWPYLIRSRPLIALGLLEGVLVRVLTCRTRPAELAEVLLTPLLPLALLPAYARAARREVEWKGRVYTQGAGETP
ncbi:glycosyltransferase [Deinococcus lacus]|uniref:Glycosyltransferase n=1 Tax=Deinococcus lacus TaxID=392561 RepID=A0ABW1YEI2_9DEIO